MRTLLVSLAVCLLIARPGTAQEQRGSIEGTVKDASGAVLPGVTVEARSPALVGVACLKSKRAGVHDDFRGGSWLMLVERVPSHRGQ